MNEQEWWYVKVGIMAKGMGIPHGTEGNGILIEQGAVMAAGNRRKARQRRFHACRQVLPPWNATAGIHRVCRSMVSNTGEAMFVVVVSCQQYAIQCPNWVASTPVRPSNVFLPLGYTVAARKEHSGAPAAAARYRAPRAIHQPASAISAMSARFTMCER